MGKIFAAVVLGVAILGVLVWAVGGPINENREAVPHHDTHAVDVKLLGADLYEARAFPALKPSETLRAVDPVVIGGYVTALEQQEVPSQVPGQILFVGEEIGEGVVQAAGVACFMAEPFYNANLYLGDQPKSTFYRRLYEGDYVTQDQRIAAVDYTKALGNVLEKKAKVHAAEAEERAAWAAAREGDERYQRGVRMRGTGAIAEEELGEKELTKIKLKEEWIAKQAAVNVSKTDLLQADILKNQHEIRNKLPYNRSKIKAILRHRGYAVKEGDAIMQLQNIDRLLAEAQLDSQYAARLRPEMTATIEPSQEEAPSRKLSGHLKDITTVAVTKDVNRPRIVSGGEDGQVLIWTPTSAGAMNALRHSGPIQVLACTPQGAAKNLCVVGLQDGTIYLWDLDSDLEKPLHVIDRELAHAGSITAVAFSPDGQFFATGCDDGSIKLWSTDTGKERYPFDAAHGVADTHQGAITALTFLPECRLVSAARDQTLRVWKLMQKGAVLQMDPIVGRDNKVSQLGVSGDGRYMLFDQGRTLQFLSVEKGQPISTLQAPGGTVPFETFAVFSPDSTLLLTAGAPEGRLQLWRTPTETERGYEVRQMVSQERWPATCAAFAPGAGQGGVNSFAVSASKHNLYVWPVPGKDEVKQHRIENVKLTLVSQSLDAGTRQMRIGFEVSNPSGRLLPGRPVTIVID